MKNYELEVYTEDNLICLYQVRTQGMIGEDSKIYINKSQIDFLIVSLKKLQNQESK